ncbi:hypothetical protein AQJ84_10485 [Streptomyces resistomycificus]|uniref:Uncharacterized protein n=1 Tax=Streptomyces resistomycificus TaxID=67356 RepID=A0A0L8LMD3_9ACTN|nr:hypothetical protein ADK37_09390 [Streptomyces resistomycificus]KUN99836.1 hypothetical protein AQJ84_10485 [Streptomyces resistomycificus]
MFAVALLTAAAVSVSGVIGRAPGRGLWASRVATDGPPAEVFSDRLPTEVYEQPVEVLPHPRTGGLLVTPKRSL